MNDYIKNLEASQMKESVDEFNVGDTVKVHNRIKEGNKERIQIFEGTVVKRQGGSNRETFTAYQDLYFAFWQASNPFFKLIGKLNVVFHTSRAALSASILE